MALSLRTWLIISAVAGLALIPAAALVRGRPAARTSCPAPCPCGDRPTDADVLTFRQGQYGHWRDVMIKR